jgi:hypothetical protein
MNRRVGDRLVHPGLAQVSARLAVARHYPLPAQKRDCAAYSTACFGSRRRPPGMPRCLSVTKRWNVTDLGRRKSRKTDEISAFFGTPARTRTGAHGLGRGRWPSSRSTDGRTGRLLAPFASLRPCYGNVSSTRSKVGNESVAIPLPIVVAHRMGTWVSRAGNPPHDRTSWRAGRAERIRQSPDRSAATATEILLLAPTPMPARSSHRCLVPPLYHHDSILAVHSVRAHPLVL